MRFETGRRRKVLINVTSLIDVVFLLLLFFVVTSTFLEQPGLDLELPEASTAEATTRREVTVRLTPDGGLFVDERAVGVQALAETLRGALEAQEGKRVVVEADARVPHGRVVEAMDAAREAGARGLIVATREEPPE